jgi:hypothetical protein
LAFFKQFASITIIWSFGYFLAYFGKISTKRVTFYDMIYLIYFGKFSLKIRPSFGLFSYLRIWPFLNLLMSKFGLFIFRDLAIRYLKPNFNRTGQGYNEKENEGNHYRELYFISPLAITFQSYKVTKFITQYYFTT